jgi:hypothetical protein
MKIILIRRCKTHPGNDDAGYGDLNAGSLEKFVAEVHSVPEILYKDHFDPQM